jgi:putative transposase
MVRSLEADRRVAVARYWAGESPNSIAASLKKSTKWVRKWIERSLEGSDDWYEEGSRRPRHSPARWSSTVEALVIQTRLRLEREGVHCGAEAIAWELESEGVTDLPSVRSLNRILARHELGRRRKGPYQSKHKAYPGPTTHTGSVHQTDFVGPRYGRQALRFYSLNTVELVSGRCAVQPLFGRDAQSTINALWASWWRLGVPHTQQVDNDAVFVGSVTHPRGMGAVLRLCLWNNVEVWFIPPAEPWRNGVVEQFNNFYGERFLRRTEIDGADTLFRESQRFEERHNSRCRYSKLNGKTPLAALQGSGTVLRFPAQAEAPRHPLPRPETGRYHLVRFVRGDGILDVFGEHFTAPPEAHYEYVRLTVDVNDQRLRMYLGERQLDEHHYPLPGRC